MRKKFVARYSDILLHLRKKMLGLVLLSFLILGGGWYFFQYDLSLDAFLFDDDPSELLLDEIRGKYGSENDVFIAADSGSNVFTEPYLKQLYEFQQRLERDLPYIDEATSLITVADIVIDEDGGLKSRDLIPDFTGEILDADLEALRQYTLNDEMYRNQFVNAEGSVSALILRFKAPGPTEGGLPSTGPDDEIGALFGTESPAEAAEPEFQAPPELNNQQLNEVERTLRQLTAEYSRPGFELYAGGFAILESGIMHFMLQDLWIMLSVLLGVIIVMLLITFRRPHALLTLPIVGLSLLGSGGLMFYSGTPLTITTMIMPPLMMAISVCSGSHFLNLFFRLYDGGLPRDEALRLTIDRTFIPIVLTSITTAGGILSFMTSRLRPIHDFGVFGALGILLSMVYTLTVIPAVLSCANPKRRPLPDLPANRGGEASEAHRLLTRKSNGIDRWLHFCGRFSYRHPYAILLVCLLLSAGAVYSFPKMELHHRTLTWLPDGAKIRRDAEFIDRNLGGSNIVNILINSGRDGGIFEPEFLRRVEAFEQFALSYGRDGLKPSGTMSLIKTYRKANMVLNRNDPNFRRLPDTRELAAQEMLLLENSGSDDLSRQVDTARRELNILIRTPDFDAVSLGRYVQTLEDTLQNRFKSGKGETFAISGSATTMSRTVYLALESMLWSYLVAMIVITVLMVIFLRSVLLGLLSMLPNLVPILVTVTAMFLLGIDLDLFVTMTGSIVLGLAVDDTIHFMSTYQRLYRLEGRSCPEAILITLTSSGRTIVLTSLILVLAFGTFLLGEMNNMKNFAVTSGIAITTALLCDLFLTPALMTVLDRWNRRPIRKA